MLISPPHSRQDGNAILTYRGNPLDVVNHVRCLGVLVDDSLSWSHHVAATIAKVSRKIGALKRVRRQLTVQARRQFLLSVIEPD